jgi:hypothetical protein
MAAVDKGLEDGWLVSLNSLAAFDLTRTYLKNDVESDSAQARRLSRWTLPTNSGEL